MSAPQKTRAGKDQGKRRRQGGDGSPGGRRRTRGPARERTAFEWTLLVVALAAIGVVLSGLFVYAAGRSGGQAELALQARDTGVRSGGNRQVELTVRNTGGAAAEQVVAEVTMGAESREVTLTRIPKDDEATAMVWFPAGIPGTPQAELLSYNEPS